MYTMERNKDTIINNLIIKFDLYLIFFYPNPDSHQDKVLVINIYISSSSSY